MATPVWWPAVAARARRQHFVITRGEALALGVSPHDWRSGARGLLSPVMTGVALVHAERAPAVPGPRQRGCAALIIAGSRHSALCLGSVLRLHDVAGTPRADLEHVLRSRGGAHVRRDVARHHFALGEGELTTRWSLPMTTLERAVTDAVRTYDRAHAVSVLDSAARHGVAVAELARLASRRRAGWFDLVDADAESPLETRARLLFGDHGLRWRSQVVLTLPSYGVARVDFLLGRCLVVECDGTEIHDAPVARFRDRVREDALRAAGYEVLRVTWGDVVHRPLPTLERIRVALQRAG